VGVGQPGIDMKLFSPFAQASLVCLVCSGILFLVSKLFTTIESGIFIVLGLTAYYCIFFALGLGVFFGLIGVVAGPIWERRLESLAGSSSCVSGLLLLLLR
jgi:hypothetical protein